MTTAEDFGPSIGRRTLLAAVAAAIGLAAAPGAEATTYAPTLVDLQVIDRETGQAARVWRKGGRLYVAGRPGARYGLRVSNNTSGRVLVVMSVDGVNILTGETAGYGQRGYVFGPYQSYDVNGWRKSDAEVAAFTFTAHSRSYAARTGRPLDVGVIGIAAFTERTYEPPLAVGPEFRGRDTLDSAEESAAAGGRLPPAVAPPSGRSAPSAQAMRPRERLGTGHGAREWSAAAQVPFERATSHPQQVRRIEYDSYANLVAAGVIPRRRPTPPQPRPFPESPGGYGYVPDPPYGG